MDYIKPLVIHSSHEEIDKYLDELCAENERISCDTLAQDGDSEKHVDTWRHMVHEMKSKLNREAWSYFGSRKMCVLFISSVKCAIAISSVCATVFS